MKNLLIALLICSTISPVIAQEKKPISPSNIDAMIGARSVNKYASCEISEEAALNTARNIAAGIIQKQAGSDWRRYLAESGSFYESIILFVTGPVTPAHRDWVANSNRAADPEKYGWLQRELGPRWNHLGQYMRNGHGRGTDYRSMFIALCEPSIAEPPRITFSHPTADHPIALRWVNVAPIQGGGYLYIPVEER